MWSINVVSITRSINVSEVVVSWVGIITGEGGRQVFLLIDCGEGGKRGKTVKRCDVVCVCAVATGYKRGGRVWCVTA